MYILSHLYIVTGAFVALFLFFTFHFSKTGQQTKTIIGGKDDPFLEEVEAKGHPALLRVFGGRAILDIQYIQPHQT